MSAPSFPLVFDNRALLMAANRGNLAAVQVLLPGANVQERAQVLFIACRDYDEPMALWVLGHGDKELSDESANECLGLAVRNCMPQVVTQIAALNKKLDFETVMIAALVKEDLDMVHVLARHTNLDPVIAYFTSPSPVNKEGPVVGCIERLDHLARHMTSTQRGSLLASFGATLLPRTQACEHAHLRGVRATSLGLASRVRRPRNRV